MSVLVSDMVQFGIRTYIAFSSFQLTLFFGVVRRTSRLRGGAPEGAHTSTA